MNLWKTATLFAGALLASGCASSSAPTPSPSPGIGESLFDASVTVTAFALTADGHSAMAITRACKTAAGVAYAGLDCATTAANFTLQRQQLQEIDLTTREAKILCDLPDDAVRTQMKRGANSDFYYVKDDPTSGEYGAWLIRINSATWCSGEHVVASFLHDPSIDESYTISPDGQYVGLNDEVGNFLLSPNGGTEKLTGGSVLYFSPDSKRALLGDLAILDLNTKTTRQVALAHPEDVNFVRIVRWDERGLFALTSYKHVLYADDLLHGTTHKLWPVATNLYVWGDGGHIFEADGQCVQQMSTGSCHRASFTLLYRSLSDASDSHEVMRGEISTGNGLTLLPGTQNILWLIDGSLRRGGIAAKFATHSSRYYWTR